MQSWGHHPSGTKRWYCVSCKKSGVRKRKDNQARAWLSLFVKWIASKATLTTIADDAQISVQMLMKRFRTFWQNPPEPISPHNSPRVLVIDGTVITHRICMLLIAGDADSSRPVFWFPVLRETYATWFEFLLRVKQHAGIPVVVVCDGQRGLIKAIHEVLPQVIIQRCLVHVIRQASLWLTQCPKTVAGRQLLLLVKELSHIRTKRQKRRWIRALHAWQKKHETFLKERTITEHRRWYTHRKMRAIRSLIKNALPDLFRFISDPSIPRTSNHVEGGMNSRIKELLRCHRGISPTKKLALASWYLSSRQG